MMDNDCDEPYTGGIDIDNFGDFKIKAKTSYPGGRVHPVCVVCENIDMKVGIEINIDQQPCSVSKNCPADYQGPPTGKCNGFLDHIDDPKKIEFKFVADKSPQVSDLLATEFFVNKDASACPITKCSMMGADCNAPYLDGITISDSAPWKINAVSNYVGGWNDPVCIVCENVD